MQIAIISSILWGRLRKGLYGSISEDIQVNSMTTSFDLNEGQNTFNSLDQFLQQQEQKIHNFEVSLSKMIEINEDLKSAENRYDVINNKDDDIQDK